MPVLHHYVPTVSVNVHRQMPSRPAVRARKRLVDSHSLTFEKLKQLMKTRLQSGATVGASSAPNLFSALTGFMEERGYRDHDAVGSTLRASYKRNVTAHAEALKAQGRPKPYIANRKSLLTHWRRALIEADRASAAQLGRASPFQAALRELFANGATMKGTSRVAGVPLPTLKRWLAGAVPNAKSVRWVPCLERHFGIPAGTLGDLLPFRLSRGKGSVPPLAAIEYRERLRAHVTDKYAVKAPNERLRREWQELTTYKVQTTNACRQARMLRSKSGKWSMTSEPVKPMTESLWYAFHGTKYVASADILWSFVSQYLGWLQLGPVIARDNDEVAPGGKGLDAEVTMTLANLARADWLEDYVEWRVERSGGVFHEGIVRLLKAVSSLCHPTTGYLTQCWAKFKDVEPAMTQDDWTAACNDAYLFAADTLADREAGTSRSSIEPIGHVLDLPNPLDAIADAVIRLDADRPSTGGIDEAIWARNRLLLKLLASNPLRDKNVRMLTYRPDGKGHLRCVDGVWRISIPKAAFKNFNGAAKHRHYDMPIRPEVWPDIERYLRDYRPMLSPDDSPYFFASSRDNTGPMKGLRRAFASLMRKYVAQCPSAGPHAMRHIVATSILKKRPNDWMAAAWALHDEVETVLKHYGHLKSDDAHQWYAEVMAGPFARM